MTTPSSAFARVMARAKKNTIVTFIRRQSPVSVAAAGAVLVLVAYTVMFTIAALSNALLFDGYAADGAFQALNPLRRIAAGEAIGADFNTFHGVGVPLLHLPLYYIFGQGLFASELGRWLLSPALFMVSAFGFFYVFKRSLKAALIAAAIVTAVAMHSMSLFVLPFTSMLGVRSVMAVLLAMLMLGQARFSKPLGSQPWLAWITRYEVLAGVTLVACLLCGTEFGVAAILGFFIAHTLYKVDPASTWRQRLLSSLRIGAVFTVVLLLALTIITHGQPLTPLLYAFGAIPADQFWYFGVPPNNFLHLGNIIPMFWNDNGLHISWVFAAIAAAVIIAMHRLRTHRLHTQVFIYMFLAGAFAMVSMLGYYHYSEAYALARMSLLIIVAGSMVLWAHVAARASFTATLKVARTKIRMTTRHLGMAVAGVFVVVSVGYSAFIAADTIKEYDIKKVLRKTKAYVLGQDTNVLDESWGQDLSMLMPVIQADNTVVIADVTEGDFVHGIHTKSPELIVDAGKHASFVRHGQTVYFNNAGRQVVGKVVPYGQGKLRVTLQNKATVLSPNHDGAPQKLVIAEDFAHDNTKIWSTYSTMFEQEMGVFNPTRQKADYIIHALGPGLRQQYIDDFNKTQPRYVITLKKSYFVYEEWLQNASWDFYSLVDKNYEAVKDGTMHVLWKRRDQPWVNPLASGDNWQPLSYNQAENTIAMPAIDFGRLPDVNAYINEQRTKETERIRANGGKAEPRLLLPRDEFIQNIGQREVEKIELEQPKFEGQGHNTIPSEDDEKDKEEKEKRLASGADLLQPRRAVVLIKLRYETKNPLEKVPLLGKTARFLVQPNNLYSRTQVSLAPYKNEVVFPVVVSELNKNSFLSIKNYALLPSQPETKIMSVEWQLLDTSAANLKALTDWPGPSLRQP